MKLAPIISEAIQQQNQLRSLNREIYSSRSGNQENEFLFLLKPELFVDTSPSKLIPMLELIENQLKIHKLQVENIRLINAPYLKQYDVMARHYGVINAAARNFKTFRSPEVDDNFKKAYKQSMDDVRILGALEMLDNKIMDASTLNELWKGVDIKRLAGGIYSGKVHYKGNDLFIVNGFHPPQLEHFIAKGRMIVTMNLVGNISWKTARQELIGNTYPEKAKAESIRGTFYKRYHKFGFDDVSYVLNSVHLSAGPLEGLLELQRFNSAFENSSPANIENFKFGKQLLENFSPEKVEKIVQNPMVQYEGKPTSLFDLTEEMDSKQALSTLLNILTSD